MRVGLLGGSFDPPHHGHLAMARALRDGLDLDEVILMPARRPPHKLDRRDMASAEDRVAMLRLAAGEEYEISTLELERTGPSYTVDTLRALRRRRPGDELVFAIGADSVGELPTWREADALFELTSFAVLERPGVDLRAGLRVVARELGEEAAEALRRGVVPMEPQPVSSTELREAIGRGSSEWTAWVHPEVATYITTRGLYERALVSTKATVRRLAEYVGQEVTLEGWLYKFRGKGKLAFLHLRDGTGIVQVILKRDVLGAEVISALKGSGQESAVTVTGSVRADERALGGVEVEATSAEVISQAADEYPIALQDHGIDFLLSKRHLWLRSTQQHATIRVRAEVVQAIRDFFYERDFVHVDAPIFTPAACEGTTDLFEVKYFEDKAYLSQSGQLYMEAAAMAHRKVYCFGPTFRAEKSKTRRHLTEFWMVEPEMAFATLEDAMQLAEEFLVYVIGRVLERCQPELKTLERDTTVLEAVQGPFPRVSYDEAVKLLHDKGIEFEWGSDFGAPHETAISEHYQKPVMIHRWPKQIKAFYMQPDPEDDRLVLGVDIIAPEGAGEVIGGGQRAVDLQFLIDQIAAHDLPQAAFEWYLDLRRYGSVPHAGFGLGLERTVAWICGREHIREAIPFPRTLYRKEP